MDNPRPFPLLRLPNVALQEVLSTMNPLELIFLTKTSQKTRRIAKSVSTIKPISLYFLHLHFGDPSVEIGGAKTHYFYNISSDTDQDGFEEDDYENYYKKSEDEITELMELAEHVMGVFGWPVTRVILDFEKFEEKNELITDWLKLHVKSTEDCHIEGDDISDEHASYFFSNMKITKELVLSAKMSDNYHLSLPQYIKNIEIHQSEYITIGQLTGFDCEFLKLCNTKITNQELNQFFKNWMKSESNVKLRTFQIHIENEEAFNRIVDLPGAEKVNAGTVRVLQEEHVTEGWDIRRNDGAVATLFTKIDEDEGDLDLIMLVH